MSFLQRKEQNAVVPTTNNGSQLPSRMLTALPKTATWIDDKKVDGFAGWAVERARKVKPETEATDRFFEVVRNFLKKMRENGGLARFQNYSELAGYLTSQLDVQSALETLLYKKSALVPGNGEVVVWFDMYEQDPLAPLMTAIVTENSYKVLPATASAAQIARFRVDFIRRLPDEKPAQPESAS
jgi:hypothetical protein